MGAIEVAVPTTLSDPGGVSDRKLERVFEGLDKGTSRGSQPSLKLYLEAFYHTALIAVATGLVVGEVDGELRRADRARMQRWSESKSNPHSVSGNSPLRLRVEDLATDISLRLLHFDIGFGMVVAGFLKTLLTEREEIFNTVEENRVVNLRKLIFARHRRPRRVSHQKK